MRPGTLASRMEANPPDTGGSYGSADGLGIQVFTSGMIARMLHVAPRTVGKWIDSGRLKGYRLPDGRDRRVPRASLLEWLTASGIPIPPALQDGIALAVCLTDAADALPGWEFADAFGAGSLCAKRPILCALIGDSEGTGAAVKIATNILAVHPAARVALIVSEDARYPIPGWTGKVHRRPVSVKAVAAELVEVKRHA